MLDLLWAPAPAAVDPEFFFDWKEPVNPIPLDVRHEMALFFQAFGSKPSWSTGMEGEYTCGYGYLDNYGYWEYPIQ